MATLYFYNMDSNYAETLNQIDVLTWGVDNLLKGFRADLKKAMADRDETKEAALLAGKEWTETRAEEKAINVLENKIANLRSYQRSQLFGDKTANTSGLYDYIGLDGDFYATYQAMQDEGNFQAYFDNIKFILDKMSMDTSNKVVNTLAKRLERAVGIQSATLTQKNKGQRTKLTAVQAFQRTMADRLLELVSKRSNTVVCRTADTYKPMVEFDNNLKVVKVWAVPVETVEE